MPDLKLAKLPDRTPVKIAIVVSPELNRDLQAYARLYQEAYGTAETVAEMIPYMLEGFLASDRGFAKARKEQSGFRESAAGASRDVSCADASSSSSDRR